MDDNKHRKVTGVSNKVILDNARKLVEAEKGLKGRIKVIFRTPVIPTVNDNKEELREITSFLKNLGKDGLVLIPFNKFGKDKYAMLGLEYPAGNFKNIEKGKWKQLRESVYNAQLDDFLHKGE